MRKVLTNAEVVERGNVSIGMSEVIWYSLDYRDTDGVTRSTIQYGKDVDEACRKIGIDWLEVSTK